MMASSLGRTTASLITRGELPADIAAAGVTDIRHRTRTDEARMTTTRPTFEGVKQAAERLKPHMAPTPLYRSETLSRALDADVWLKQETATPIASFKLRGALNHLLVAQSQTPIKSAVTSSTGNHGQGVAYAARLLGVPADIFLPDGCPIVKQTMIKLFGATLHVGGVDIDDAKERARKFCTERGGSFVDDGESARLIEGAGTIGHEIGAALEDVDYAFVPMGSGSLVAGTAIGLKGTQPRAKRHRRAVGGRAGHGRELPRQARRRAPRQQPGRIHRLPRARRHRAHRRPPPCRRRPAGERPRPPGRPQHAADLGPRAGRAGLRRRPRRRLDAPQGAARQARGPRAVRRQRRPGNDRPRPLRAGAVRSDERR